jgi:uncharacterized protein
MDRQQISRIIQDHQNELNELGVRYLAVFGATVWGEAGENSDVDLLVEFNRPIGLLHFSKVRLRLEALLGQSVDLVSRTALIDERKEDILAEAVDVF